MGGPISPPSLPPCVTRNHRDRQEHAVYHASVVSQMSDHQPEAPGLQVAQTRKHLHNFLKPHISEVAKAPMCCKLPHVVPGIKCYGSAVPCGTGFTFLGNNFTARQKAFFRFSFYTHSRESSIQVKREKEKSQFPRRSLSKGQTKQTKKIIEELGISDSKTERSTLQLCPHHRQDGHCRPVGRGLHV